MNDTPDWLARLENVHSAAVTAPSVSEQFDYILGSLARLSLEVQQIKAEFAQAIINMENLAVTNNE